MQSKCECDGMVWLRIVVGFMFFASVCFWIVKVLLHIHFSTFLLVGGLTLLWRRVCSFDALQSAFVRSWSEM